MNIVGTDTFESRYYMLLDIELLYFVSISIYSTNYQQPISCLVSDVAVDIPQRNRMK